jgi:hypothetical protein
VAVALDEVIRGYEAVVEALGFEAAVVEAGLLALASLHGEGQGDRLLVNWDDSYVSFLLQRGDQPLMARTLPGEGGAAGVARQAISTLQFYRDRLSGEGLSDVIVRAAACPVEEALSTLRPVLDCDARLLQPWSALGPVHSDVPSQGLAGAAASALRRAS